MADNEVMERLHIIRESVENARNTLNEIKVRLDEDAKGLRNFLQQIGMAETKKTKACTRKENIGRYRRLKKTKSLVSIRQLKRRNVRHFRVPKTKIISLMSHTDLKKGITAQLEDLFKKRLEEESSTMKSQMQIIYAEVNAKLSNLHKSNVELFRRIATLETALTFPGRPQPPNDPPPPAVAQIASATTTQTHQPVPQNMLPASQNVGSPGSSIIPATQPFSGSRSRSRLVKQRIIVCVNCHEHSWNSTCLSGSPCENCIIEGVTCLRPRCVNFPAKTCPNGDNCQYAHEDDDPRISVTETAVTLGRRILPADRMIAPILKELSGGHIIP